MTMLSVALAVCAASRRARSIIRPRSRASVTTSDESVASSGIPSPGASSAGTSTRAEDVDARAEAREMATCRPERTTTVETAGPITSDS